MLSFVFYHCRGGGSIQHQLYGLEFYGYSVHGVGYWSVGLGELEAEQCAETDNPMAWALAAWMRQQRRGRAELRLRLLNRILRFVRDENYRRLALDAVRSYFRLSTVEQEEEAQLLQSGRFGEVQEMLQTELGRLEEAARREGQRIGQLEGQREALQSVVIRFLRSRFASVPESVEAQVRRVQDVDALNTLIDRAATAGSLEELQSLLGP